MSQLWPDLGCCIIEDSTLPPLPLPPSRSPTPPLSPPPSPPLSQFSFSLFVRFPAELQLEILGHCPQNDLVCLSLSSHAFRALTLPLIPEQPYLLYYDQNLPKESLECSCGEKNMTGVAQNARAHRKGHHSWEDRVNLKSRYSRRVRLGCHDFSPCRKYPADHAVCKKPRCRHCSCTTCPLHVRLQGWMGDRKFCHDCRMFTKRPRSGKNKGRCESPLLYTHSHSGLLTNADNLPGLHGRPPIRRRPDNRWTYKKGSSYGRGWWKMWGTWGIDRGGNSKGDSTADASSTRNARVV